MKAVRSGGVFGTVGTVPRAFGELAAKDVSSERKSRGCIAALMGGELVIFGRMEVRLWI